MTHKKRGEELSSQKRDSLKSTDEEKKGEWEPGENVPEGKKKKKTKKMKTGFMPVVCEPQKKKEQPKRR